MGNSNSTKLEYNVEEAFNRDKNAININKVTEDELLLLPGLNRQLAINIIQYRHVNNGFKRVDDILQVKGINSNIFKRFSNDIIIDNSSIITNTKQEPINLNLASYEELCSVPYLTSVHIKRIIQRRKRKGSFRFIEDLLKIKGINYIILAKIRPYITIKDNTLPISISNYSLNNYQALFNHSISTDTHSIASMILDTMPVEVQSLLIPSVSFHHSITITDENSFRLASWNLDKLTNEKIKNPGVREVICRVILENSLSLIGFQEIYYKEAIDLIIQELNNPTISSIKDCSKNQQKKWNYIISNCVNQSSENEYLGFIYDESIGIELNESILLTSINICNRCPFIGLFRINKKFDFSFVNMHVDLKESDDEQIMKNFIQLIDKNYEQKYRIILGSFGYSPKTSYSLVIQQNTDIYLDKPQGLSCTDNILLSPEAQTLNTEKSGVIRDNLSNFWIPNGWSWGGLVSNHCPIWTEFKLIS